MLEKASPQDVVYIADILEKTQQAETLNRRNVSEVLQLGNFVTTQPNDVLDKVEYTNSSMNRLAYLPFLESMMATRGDSRNPERMPSVVCLD